MRSTFETATRFAIEEIIKKLRKRDKVWRTYDEQCSRKSHRRSL